MSFNDLLRSSMPKKSFQSYEAFEPDKELATKSRDIKIQKSMDAFKKSIDNSKGIVTHEEVQRFNLFIDKTFTKKKKSFFYKMRNFLRSFHIKLGPTSKDIRNFDSFCGQLHRKIYKNELIDFLKNYNHPDIDLEYITNNDSNTVQITAKYENKSILLPLVEITPEGFQLEGDLYTNIDDMFHENPNFIGLYNENVEGDESITIVDNPYISEFEGSIRSESALESTGMGTYIIVQAKHSMGYNLVYNTKAYTHAEVEGRVKASIKYTQNAVPFRVSNQGFEYKGSTYETFIDMREVVFQDIIINHPEIENKLTDINEKTLDRKDIITIAQKILKNEKQNEFLKVSRKDLKDHGFKSSHSFYIQYNSETSAMRIFKKVHGHKGVLGQGGFKVAKVVQEIDGSSDEIVGDLALAKGKLVYRNNRYRKKVLNFSKSERDFYKNVNREGDIAVNWLVPRVVRTRNIEGKVDDGVWFIGEVASGDLNKLDIEDLSKEKVKDTIFQMANSIEQLHLQNRVHRDIKQGNFLYTDTIDKSGEKGCQVLLTDFDMLKDVSVPDTEYYSFSGTRSYAPKVLRTKLPMLIKAQSYMKIDSYALMKSMRSMLRTHPDQSLRAFSRQLQTWIDSADGNVDFEDSLSQRERLYQHWHDIKNLSSKDVTKYCKTSKGEEFLANMTKFSTDLEQLCQNCMDEIEDEASLEELQKIRDSIQQIKGKPKGSCYKLLAAHKQLINIYTQNRLNCIPTISEIIDKISNI